MSIDRFDGSGGAAIFTGAWHIQINLVLEALRTKLVGELDRLVRHLERYQEKRWREFFGDMKRRVEQGDGEAVGNLARLPGGMNSFSDLVICRINGHKIEPHEEDSANEELARLRESVVATAVRLKRLDPADFRIGDALPGSALPDR